MTTMRRTIWAVAGLAAATGTPTMASERGYMPLLGLERGDPGIYYSRNDSCDFAAFTCAGDLVVRGETRAALPLLARAAARGSGRAMRAIGLIYARGEGDTAQNLVQASRWFNEGALRGDAVSMYALGISYRRGLGVEADPALARQWLRRAADAGYAPARAALTTF